MAAKVVQLCEDIVSHLNNQSLSQAFTAFRRNIWYTNLEDTNDLQVVVTPQETETTIETRQSSSRRFRVNVIIQQKVSAQAQEDGLMQLSEEIEDALRGQAMGEFGFSEFSDTIGSRQFIDLDAAASEGLFRTVIQISYLGA
jgi:hypothetical protein